MNIVNTVTSSNKREFLIRFTHDGFDRVKALRDSAGLTTVGNTVREALRIYEWYTKGVSGGSVFLTRDAAGTLNEVVFNDLGEAAKDVPTPCHLKLTFTNEAAVTRLRDVMTLTNHASVETLVRESLRYFAWVLGQHLKGTQFIMRKGDIDSEVIMFS